MGYYVLVHCMGVEDALDLGETWYFRQHCAPWLPGIIMGAGVGAKVLICTHESPALVDTLSGTQHFNS